MNRDLFIKYIQNRCDEKELNEVIHWFQCDAGSLQGRSFLYKFWKEMKDNEEEMDEGAINLLHRIHYDINRKESEKLLQRSKDNAVSFKKRRLFIQRITRIAATLFIPLLMVSIYFLTTTDKQDMLPAQVSEVTYTRVHSPVGSVSQIELPDGSSVWLNQNTTLIYPNSFSSNTRKVQLEGEAYFNVHHNPAVPFVVSTHELDVVAKGTAFNLMAFPEMDRIEATLAEGKVTLCKVDVNGRVKEVFDMQPGQLAVFNHAKNELSYKQVNIHKYTSWKEGLLVFEDDPLQLVAERLERFYNVEIQIDNSVISEYTYTATFENENLYQVMELMKLATPIEYSITPRKRLDNDSYSKRQVFISYSGN